MTPIGLITIAIGLVCLQTGPRFAMRAFVVVMLLGSAAALFLGGGQIQPALLLMVFVAPTVLTRKAEAAAATRCLQYPNDGFWLLCITVFGVCSAIFMPRLFAGITDVNPIGGSAATAGRPTPLMPVSGNYSQCLYVLADLTTFVTAVATCRSREGHVHLARAVGIYSAANIVFALLDIGTFATGTGWMLGIIRNAQYTFHLEETSGGLKRIAGSFVEASAFSGASLGALGFTATMWIRGRWTRQMGLLSAVTLCLLALSTSSTALAGLAVLLSTLYAVAVTTAMSRPGSGKAMAVTIAAPPLFLAASAAIALSPTASATIADFLNTLVFNKAQSESGIERAAVNHAAIQNFLDTYGAGVGLGSMVSSSWVVAVPANLGVVGVLLFSRFLGGLLLTRRARPGTLDADIRAAAKVGMVALLTAAAVSDTLIELGLPFYILAALACGEANPSTAHRAGAIPARPARPVRTHASPRASETS